MDAKILHIIKKIDLFYLGLYKKIDENLQITLKDNGTSVSQFDIDATSYCIEVIKQEFPNANIWIEEDATILKSDEDEYTWIIDPLDGTASFLRGYPVWGIGISILRSTMPILSYFYGPACNQKYLSYEDKIFVNDRAIVKQESRLSIDTSTIFISSRLHKKIDFKEFSDYKLRNFGSTIYHLFMVVLGRAESVLIGSCYIWDLAAVFELADKNRYEFLNFSTKEIVSIENLMVFKSSKIDMILEFKRVQKR